MCILWVGVVERLKEKVEEYFGCEYELFVEFTGLIRLVLLLYCKIFIKFSLSVFS